MRPEEDKIRVDWGRKIVVAIISIVLASEVVALLVTLAGDEGSAVAVGHVFSLGITALLCVFTYTGKKIARFFLALRLYGGAGSLLIGAARALAFDTRTMLAIVLGVMFLVIGFALWHSDVEAFMTYQRTRVRKIESGQTG